MEPRSPAKGDPVLQVKEASPGLVESKPSKKLVSRGNVDKRGLGSLLFDGEVSPIGNVIGNDLEKVSGVSKKRSSSQKRFVVKRDDMKERDPLFSTTAMDNRNKSHTGVPRADSTPVSSTRESTSAVECSISSSQPQGKRRRASPGVESDTLRTLVKGVRSLQGTLDLQHQLTQRIVEWQERSEVGSLQEWFRSQNELAGSILERQKQLEDRIQSCMGGSGELTFASAVSNQYQPAGHAPSGSTHDVPPLAIEASSMREFEHQKSLDAASAATDKEPEQKKPPKSAMHDRDTGRHHDPSEHCHFTLSDEVMEVQASAEDESDKDSTDTVAPKNTRVSEDSRKTVHVHQHWKTHHHEHHLAGENCVERLVDHPYFEYASAVVIFTHSLFIGLYVEYIASFDSDGHVAFTIGNLVLTFIFLLEVGLKMFAEKKAFFTGGERFWNIFDVGLICLVLLELSLGIILAGKDKKKMKTVLKIAEMARTVRILRIFRFLKFSETLQVIIVKIFMSVRTLSWVFLLICMMQAVIAVCFTQGANEFLGGVQHDPSAEMTLHQEAVYKHFGSVSKSVNTCFASISGGILWEEVSEELSYISILYALIFGFYIATSTFATLNIITGMFINDMLLAERDLEDEYKNIKLERYHDDLSELFHQADDSADGNISLDEFMNVVHTPVLMEILDDLNMAPEEAGTLFHLLDEDNSGELDAGEFLAGCLHLMGGTTGLDTKVLLYENRRLRHKLTDFMRDTDDMLRSIRSHIKGVEHDLHKQAAPKEVQPVQAPRMLIPVIKKQGTQTLANKVARQTTAKRKESKIGGFNKKSVARMKSTVIH